MTLSKTEMYFRDCSDQEDYLLQEKIKRYLNFRKIFNKLDDTLKANGVTITVKNGSQEFVKLNPAIDEKQRLNKEMLELEKQISSAIKAKRKSVPKTPPKLLKGGLV